MFVRSCETSDDQLQLWFATFSKRAECEIPVFACSRGAKFFVKQIISLEQTMIRDIPAFSNAQTSKRPVEDPILAYNADGEANNLHGVAASRIGLYCVLGCLQILRV